MKGEGKLTLVLNYIPLSFQMSPPALKKKKSDRGKSMHAFIKLLYCVNGLIILPVKTLRYTITAVHVLPNSHKKRKAFLRIVLFAPTLMPSHHLKNTFLRGTFCAGLQNNSSIQTSSAFFSEPLAPIKAN